MRRLDLFAVGRLKEAGLRASCDDYYQRCRRTLRIQEREFRSLDALIEALPARAFVVLLDERGQQWDSRTFASRIDCWSSQPARRLVLAIGAADGFADSHRQRADQLWALGKLTFAHRLVRLVVAEQLFRAVSIIEGSPYHRD